MAGKEPSFGLNSFNKAKYKSETETVANAIVNLLFGRPGYFPSMPDLGIHIQDMMYMFWDEIDTDMIKAKIAVQCETFKEYIQSEELDVIKSEYNGKPLLLVVIPVQIKHTQSDLGIGITQDKQGNLIYNYVVDTTTD